MKKCFNITFEREKNEAKGPKIIIFIGLIRLRCLVLYAASIYGRGEKFRMTNLDS